MSNDTNNTKQAKKSFFARRKQARRERKQTRVLATQDPNLQGMRALMKHEQTESYFNRVSYRYADKIYYLQYRGFYKFCNVSRFLPSVVSIFSGYALVYLSLIATGLSEVISAISATILLIILESLKHYLLPHFFESIYKKTFSFFIIFAIVICGGSYIISVLGIEQYHEERALIKPKTADIDSINTAFANAIKTTQNNKNAYKKSVMYKGVFNPYSPTNRKELSAYNKQIEHLREQQKQAVKRATLANKKATSSANAKNQKNGNFLYWLVLICEALIIAFSAFVEYYNYMSALQKSIAEKYNIQLSAYEREQVQRLGMLSSHQLSTPEPLRPRQQEQAAPMPIQQPAEPAPALTPEVLAKIVSASISEAFKQQPQAAPVPAPVPAQPTEEKKQDKGQGKKLGFEVPTPNLEEELTGLETQEKTPNQDEKKTGGQNKEKPPLTGGKSQILGEKNGGAKNRFDPRQNGKKTGGQKDGSKNLTPIRNILKTDEKSSKENLVIAPANKEKKGVNYLIKYKHIVLFMHNPENKSLTNRQIYSRFGISESTLKNIKRDIKAVVETGSYDAVIAQLLEETK